MEVRKVQKTGTSTMTVSLPKRWVTSNNLQAGDQVNVEIQQDGTLSINLKDRRKREHMSAVIWISKGAPDDHLTRRLIGAYLAGFNIIEVRSKERIKLDTKRAIKDFARLVIGPEIVEETATSVVLHDLSDPLELPPKKCVRRMHLIVDSMHRDAMATYAGGDVALARDVIDRDQDVDRLYWMALKQHTIIQRDRGLAKQLDVDLHDSLSLMLAARILERVGDHAEKIALQAIATMEEPKTELVTGEMHDLSKKAVEILARAVDSLFLHDISAANLAIDDAEDLVHEGERMFPRLTGQGGKGTMSRTAVMDSILRTIMYSTDIAEISINDTMRSEMKSSLLWKSE